MKLRNFIILGLFMSIILSACSKKEEAVPASLVGKWTAQGLGTTTNVKSYDVTTAELTAYAQTDTSYLDFAEYVSTIAYEFKSDGTYTSTADADNGKWTLSSDNKTLTLTSSVYVSGGVAYTEVLEVQDLAANSVKLAFPKTFTVSGGVPSSTSIDFFYYVLSFLPLELKISTLEAAQTTTFRGYYSLKR